MATETKGTGIEVARIEEPGKFLVGIPDTTDLDYLQTPLLFKQWILVAHLSQRFTFNGIKHVVKFNSGTEEGIEDLPGDRFKSGRNFVNVDQSLSEVFVAGSILVDRNNRRRRNLVHIRDIEDFKIVDGKCESVSGQQDGRFWLQTTEVTRTHLTGPLLWKATCVVGGDNQGPLVTASVDWFNQMKQTHNFPLRRIS